MFTRTSMLAVSAVAITVGTLPAHATPNGASMPNSKFSSAIKTTASNPTAKIVLGKQPTGPVTAPKQPSGPLVPPIVIGGTSKPGPLGGSIDSKPKFPTGPITLPTKPGTPPNPGNNPPGQAGGTPGQPGGQGTGSAQMPGDMGQHKLPDKVVIIRQGQPVFIPVRPPAAFGQSALVYTQPASVVAPSPVMATPSAAGFCLTKEYLESGLVLFRDVCSKEWAMNNTTVSRPLTAASARACLSKDSLAGGTVLFHDNCSGEWAKNPLDRQAEAPAAR